MFQCLFLMSVSTVLQVAQILSCESTVGRRCIDGILTLSCDCFRYLCLLSCRLLTSCALTECLLYAVCVQRLSFTRSSGFSKVCTRCLAGCSGLAL